MSVERDNILPPEEAPDASSKLFREYAAEFVELALAILLASAMAATFVGRRASNAVSQGRCLVPWILA
jgi:hypothetical protein